MAETMMKMCRMSSKVSWWTKFSSIEHSIMRLCWSDLRLQSFDWFFIGTTNDSLQRKLNQYLLSIEASTRAVLKSIREDYKRNGRTTDDKFKSTFLHLTSTRYEFEKIYLRNWRNDMLINRFSSFQQNCFGLWARRTHWKLF